MDYRKYDDTVYIRMDKGDEIIGSILDVCRKEQISSATFSGIGGCSEAQIQTFLPETGTFETETISVLYTAEIELRPIKGGTIRKKFNEETGTGFWSFK